MTSTLQSRELLNELKLAKSKNSLIFAITDDCAGLSQLLRSHNFCVILEDLEGDGNLLKTLVKWESTPDNAVYLVCGIASQFPWIFAYLNLHRDLFYQIKRPVLMAVSEYEIREIQKHAPDLYRYRSRTYNLKVKEKSGAEPIFSEPKSIYYELPIFEEEIDVDAIKDRIKLDEYMLGTVTEDYKKAELYMDLAISYFKLDDFDKGDDSSRKSMDIRARLKDDKGISINYGRLIRVFLLKKQFKRVIELSNQLLKLDQNSASTYILRGIAFGELGQLETALECYEKAVETDLQKADAWYNKGNALGNLKRHEEALESFEKATKLDPQYSDAWYNKGVALGNLKRHEEALESFEKAIELDPQKAEAWYNKGSALGGLGRTEEALEAYEKAIELDPQKAEAWSNKGVALDNLGRTEEALEAYEKAIELGLTSATLHVTLARLYRKLGSEVESAEQCKKARGLIEKENEYNRACFEAVCGSADTALKLLRSALEKKQATPDWARQDPDFDFIRDDPRSEELLDEFSEGKDSS